MRQDAPVLPVTAIDRLLRVLALLGVVLLLAGTVWVWPRLPEVVPIHFGASGRPDGWGERVWLLLLPTLGVGLYALFGAILNLLPPQMYNLPWPITEQNRERQYLFARRLLLAFRTYAVFLLVLLLLQASRVALGKAPGLGWWFLPATLAAPCVILGVYFGAASRAR